MRRDVLELRQFYASDLGSAARAMVARKLTEAEIEALYYSAGHYVRLKDQYLAGGVA